MVHLLTPLGVSKQAMKGVYLVSPSVLGLYLYQSKTIYNSLIKRDLHDTLVITDIPN